MLISGRILESIEKEHEVTFEAKLLNFITPCILSHMATHSLAYSYHKFVYKQLQVSVMAITI